MFVRQEVLFFQKTRCENRVKMINIIKWIIGFFGGVFVGGLLGLFIADELQFFGTARLAIILIPAICFALFGFLAIKKES
jgi:uncharacterized membrane protein YoaK (UPF0700 family)